jgi:hypothetical protein
VDLSILQKFPHATHKLNDGFSMFVRFVHRAFRFLLRLGGLPNCNGALDIVLTDSVPHYKYRVLPKGIFVLT